MGLNILNRINYGYGEFEPVIIGLMAMNKNFMLIGRHGTGKTRIAKILSRGYGDEGFVFYDATKDDLISIAGIPDANAIKNGKMEFVAHNKSIWNKSTIVVDEITRASKENQNLWLEIMEEKKCFGIPIPYRTLIATANPESYAAAFQLDEALMDRFYAVIPVPEMQEGISGEDIEAMIDLAGKSDGTVSSEEMARTFFEIQYAHAALIRKGVVEKIKNYLGALIPPLMSVLKSSDGPYISPRTYSRNLPQAIIAIAAYHEVAGTTEPLQTAAWESLKYVIATKLQIKPAILKQLHEDAKALLKSGDISELDKTRSEIISLSTFEEKLEFLRKNSEKVQEHLKSDEKEKLFGELLRGASEKGDQEKLVLLKVELEKLGYEGDILRQLDGKLIITLNSAINYIIPKLGLIKTKPKSNRTKAVKNIEIFRRMVNEGTFITDNSSEILRIKTFIINVYEGDEADTEENILSFFETVEYAKRV